MTSFRAGVCKVVKLVESGDFRQTPAIPGVWGESQEFTLFTRDSDAGRSSATFPETLSRRMLREIAECGLQRIKGIF